MKAYQPLFLTNFLRNTLKCFNFVFFGVWAALTAYEILYLELIQDIDSGSNPKYAVLCNIGLAGYSFLWGYVWSRGIKFVKYYLPTLLLPVALSIMEFINFTHILRFSFFAQLFHYAFFGILWFLFWNLLVETPFISGKAQRVLVVLQSFFELLILWLSVSIMINALLNGGINDDAVIAMCQTNTSEAWHYFWGINHGLILVCGMAGIFAVLCLLISRTRKKTAASLQSGPRQTVSIQIELTCFVCFLGMIGYLAHMHDYYPTASWETLKAYNRYHEQTDQYQKLMQERKNLMEQHLALYKDISNNSNGIFVLIIGESLDRRYMGCYDDTHATTPFQSALRKQHNTVFFDRAYACHVVTTKVVPMMLTMYNQYVSHKNLSDAELTLSILELAKETGFQTYWFSNQEKISYANSIITSIASAANECLFMRDYDPKSQYDHELLSAMENTQFSERSLVCIHLNGSHYPYGLAFPPDFEFPDGLTTYEKTVYYNDSVIQRIVSFFQARNAMLISYVSDHADAVSIGKGHDPRPNKFNREMVEIPLWFHVSEQYEALHPQLFERLRDSSGKVITNDLMFNMLLDLMSFQYSSDIKEFSPLSSDYILDREHPKTLDGLIDIPSP